MAAFAEGVQMVTGMELRSCSMRLVFGDGSVMVAHGNEIDDFYERDDDDPPRGQKGWPCAGH